MSFHVDGPDFATGEVNHLTEWFGERVDIDAFFLDPDDVTARRGGRGPRGDVDDVRRPLPGGEYPSRRCYLLAQRA